MRIYLNFLVSMLLLSLTYAGGSFNVADKTEGVTQINFTIGDFSIENVEGYQRLITDGAGSTVEAGRPELPVYSTLFQMEPGFTYSADYVVTASHVISDVTIYPFQDALREKTETEVELRDDSFYNSADVYPANHLSVTGPVVMRNLELLSLSLVPFSYNAGTRELEVFDAVDITVSQSGTRDLTLANQMPRSRVFESLYGSLVVNYEPSDRDEDYQAPAVLYICGGGSNGAISHPAFQALVEWRHKNGYIVYTASTDETGSSNNQIKNYIQDAYETFDPPPEYVGLVGDSNGSFAIPAFSMNGGDSDHPYTQLDGGDLLPEVMVGRLSVAGATDLTVVISKTLDYEHADYMGNNWFEKAALVGDPSSSGISTIITNQYIENIMTNFGMEDVRTRFSGGFSSWMQNQLDEGIGYFNYRGYIGTSGFSCTNINNANNGQMTPFVTFITCGTGNFASDWGGQSITECFLRAGSVNNPKGGVAAIGTATSSTHTAPNNIVDMGIYDGIFSKGIETAAGGLFAGKLALYNTYPSNPANITSKFTGWNNLMGDPALRIWTDTPTIMNADYDSEIGAGSNYLEVVVTDESGNPVEGALVTAVNDDDSIFTSVLTDAAGSAIISFDPSVTGQVDLTVNKRNYKPVEGQFDIETSGPEVNLDPAALAVDDSGGNNDGLINPGESVIVTVPLENFGSDPAEGVQAWLETMSENVTIVSSTLDYGTLDPGASAAADFELSVAAAAVDLEDLGIFVQVMDSAGNTWSSLLPLTLHGGRLVISSYNVVSGYLNHGNTAEISIELKNQGSVALTNVTADVVYIPTILEISNGSLTWGDLDAGASITSENAFTVTSSGDIINGSIFSIEVHLQSAEGYDRIEYLQLQVGEATVNEPMGPDSYGYFIYGSEDLGYNLALPYNWQEIDPDHGGNGTSLNMTDNGDGTPTSQQTAHVSLPFTFSFYGVEYNEISVSTNGWISFGDTDMRSFRNYPIPGAGGPSPMLAVFWDDLKTSGGGQVYKYINADEGYVIIEWSDMHTYDENSIETFQAILYDSLTPTGDGEILLQYKDFNNTTDGDFGGYTPHHGGYSTIGTENHLGNVGLEYTFNNEWAPAAMELSDETALFITTQLPMALMLGDVNQDGEIDVSDIVLAVNYTLNISELSPLETYIADLNQDGNVNILDVILMINAILNG